VALDLRDRDAQQAGYRQDAEIARQVCTRYNLRRLNSIPDVYQHLARHG
jgi:hypothetical protein